MSDKERLENMSPIGFDLNGDVLLKSEDYHWLMEQAERVEELEKKLSINTNNMKQLQKQNVRYKQALVFYAHKKNYDIKHLSEDEHEIPVFKDYGEKARNALEGEK